MNDACKEEDRKKDYRLDRERKRETEKKIFKRQNKLKQIKISRRDKYFTIKEENRTADK